MDYFLLILHVLAAVVLVVLVLLQQGKGAEAGVAFGSGASQTLFGSQGSGNFLTRLTAIFATIFFVTSLTMAYFAAHRTSDGLITPPASNKAQKQKTGSEVPGAILEEPKRSDVPITE